MNAAVDKLEFDLSIRQQPGVLPNFLWNGDLALTCDTHSYSSNY
jgi:hypothetical protein